MLNIAASTTGGGIVARQAKSGAVQGGTKTIHVLNGPNLNLLGEREPEIYGTDTLADAERLCREAAKAGGFDLRFSQTNSEGELVDQIQAVRASAGIVINPAGCSYSVPVLDALKACTAPVIEVHISNIHARDESWRAETLTTAAAVGVISGLGILGYRFAVEAVCLRQGGKPAKR
jgi:3-dehydroquinate dehydratase-2